MSARAESPRDRPGTAGRFVTFEGIEGCGKSTQLARMAARLRADGLDPLLTREPGGTELGQRLRPLLLSRTAPPMSSLTELLLYVTDRAQHLEQVILPALRQNRLVLCDRYLDATLAYQGFGRGLGTDLIRRLHVEPPLDCRPDRTILLDLEVDVALTRARDRNRERGLESSEGRYEEELAAFHERVRAGYLELAAARPQRILVIPADGSVEQVHQRVRGALRDLLPPAER